MSESQRVAIITGASGGIGTAVAERLARDGLVVVVNCRGEAGPAEGLVSTIKGAGGQAIAYKADVSEPGAVSAMFDAATEGFGSVNVLVNNAGLMKLAPRPPRPSPGQAWRNSTTSTSWARSELAPNYRTNMPKSA